MITLPADKDGGHNGTAKVLTGTKTTFTNQGKMSTPTTAGTSGLKEHLKKNWKKYVPQVREKQR